MKKSSRYLLLGFVILVFFVFAPLLVLYVSGTRLNLTDRDTSFTGILDIKSEPSGSSVSLDNEDKGSTPAIVRFLNQGEYLVKISRDGYFDWSKRLPVESGKVTYAQVGVTAVQLIKKPEPIVIAPRGVSSFVLINNNVWFASGNSIVKASLNDPPNQIVIPLPFAPTSTKLLRDKKHILVQANQTLIIDTDTNKVLPNPPGDSFDQDTAIISSTQIIYHTSQGAVKLFNPVTNAVQTLRSNVIGFTMLGNTAYFIDQGPSPAIKSAITTAVWNGSQFSDVQLIVSDAGIAGGNLLITDSKELFCLCDRKLYRIGQSAELLNSDVVSAKLDLMTNELSFITSSETWFYNFLDNKPQLLTRSTTQTNDFLIRSNIGYGFVANSLGLEAVEIDTRDKQNRYELLKDRPVYQLEMTADEKTAVALQDGALVMTKIRD